ncbi:hypothetical protein B0T20DRAFT_98208 [Sordaria brevicollis]|uniref:C3H1-type domain-containing protein n=1 Tax=Sordaria brevicollis TaxID=83679 RepID=A0AAE0U2H0_SORBR|nr:hypothetical protein B0T20DRAFT_98208 [Sordaria brevicollis]
MTICKFYQQGTCRYGNTCRFEHPPKGPSGFQSGNRFGALAGGGGGFNSNQNSGFSNTRSGEVPYSLDADAIRKDLTEELPTWILSAYAPGKQPPEQLFGGPGREQSFEELRLYYMNGVAAGNPQQAMNDIEQLYQNAQAQIQNALSNIPAAIQFIVEAGNKHPNRFDICEQGTLPGGTTGEFGRDRPTTNAFGSSTGAFGAPAANNNPFGAPAQPAGAFGQPSALGAKPNPFGAPAFGQPAQPAAASPFGQPSALGASTSAFGAPSALGAKPNPFGAPATGGGAFGQPAAAPAFGQPTQPTSAFGQPAQLGAKPNPFGAPAAPATGAFGQPSTLGAKPNPFGAPAAPAAGAFGTSTTASPFGQSTQQAANPFGQSTTSNAFGQSTTTPAANPFGAPAQQATSSPFGASTGAATTNPFGAPAAAAPAATSSPFGVSTTTPAANPFGASTTQQPPANPFGASTTATPAANPFGQPAAAAAAPTQPAASAGAGAAAGTSPYAPNSSRQHPPISSYTTRGMDNRLATFKGKPVTYQSIPKPGAPDTAPPEKEVPVIRNFDGSFQVIWFPDGAPKYTADTEAPEQEYTPDVLAVWQKFMETGRFEGGVMPEVAPKREFCSWDF